MRAVPSPQVDEGMSILGEVGCIHTLYGLPDGRAVNQPMVDEEDELKFFDGVVCVCDVA
jgi:hypothetical protein